MGAHGAANFEEVRLDLHTDGSASLTVGVVDMGQGSHTVLAQIAAQELGVTSDLVKVSTPPSDQAPRTMGGVGISCNFYRWKSCNRSCSKSKRGNTRSRKRIF